ncbi:hypothetical protein JAAARDRAFT_41723 [Jaapia argillacea MUCL 33604]|uniref:Uncharacterized protein n=1 Tax=Jaapia argillacea MUCL 33604 TaxID=933084 RepID=A0A067PK01_9AGAM|nr:hypothetical protein JAAARDRAFT_41723 [Jaapia argillacea MUCL 33604]
MTPALLSPGLKLTAFSQPVLLVVPSALHVALLYFSWGILSSWGFSPSHSRPSAYRGFIFAVVVQLVCFRWTELDSQARMPLWTRSPAFPCLVCDPERHAHPSCYLQLANNSHGCFVRPHSAISCACGAAVIQLEISFRLRYFQRVTHTHWLIVASSARRSSNWCASGRRNWTPRHVCPVDSLPCFPCASPGLKGAHGFLTTSTYRAISYACGTTVTPPEPSFRIRPF